MSLIRTFHTIGQGAFYIENHSFTGNEFNIIYDCGSTTLRRTQLDSRIKSLFNKNQSIDALFISHFHTDHINGIETLSKHCKIKKVIIPLVDDEEKTMAKIANFLTKPNFSDTRLIDDPEDFFGGNVPIIRIEDTNADSINDSIDPNDSIDISRIDISRSLPSGTVFELVSGSSWFLIPLNYKQEERKVQFKTALADHDLTLSDISTIDKINKHKDAIIKAYKLIDGRLNGNSMILFSGKKSDDQILCCDYLQPSYLHRYLNQKIQSGCLYTGDIDLNEKNIVTSLHSKLNPFINYVGTIQIPHHGSLKNFNKAILSSQVRCAIFSYGKTNPYGHPSGRVIGDIASHNIRPHCVTEEQTSIVIQFK